MSPFYPYTSIPTNLLFFDRSVILSRPRSQILLLVAPHMYRVEASEER